MVENTRSEQDKIEPVPCTLKIGAVELSSAIYNLDQLCGCAKWIFQQPDPIIGGFWFPDEKKKRRGDDVPYDAFVLREGTKRPKWVKVADNRTKLTALSIAGREVDESISARFKIEKSEGKVKNTKEDGHWMNIAHKFRDYMSKQGTRIQTQQQHIERQRYRLDSPAEIANIKTSRANSFSIGNIAPSRSRKKRLFRI